MNNSLNLNRLNLLIKKDIALSHSIIWIVTALLVGLLLLGTLFSPNNVYSANEEPTLFLWALFIGGIWISAGTFKEAHNKLSSYAFFTLPASTIEKFFNKLLLTAVIYPLAILLFYSAFYWLIAMIGKVVNGTMPPLFNPLQLSIAQDIWTYMIFQSIFFLGAIYFKNKVLIKTALTLVIISIIFGIFTAMIGALFARSLLVGNIFYLPNFALLTSHAARSIGNIIHLSIWVLFPFFCWTIAYIRLGETEV